MTRPVKIPEEMLVVFEEILEDHHLGDWKLIVNADMRSTLGRCKHAKREVHVAAWVVERLGVAEAMETMLHELAHAMAGASADHGVLWQRMCEVLGISGEARRRGLSAAQIPSRERGFRWVAICPNHGQIGGWYGRPNDNKICRRCRERVSIVPTGIE